MRRVLVAVACAIVGLTLSVQAATIKVSSFLDVLDGGDGLCTLREAVIAVNTGLASGFASGECPAGDRSDDAIVLPAGNYVLTIPRTYGNPCIDPSDEDFAEMGDLDLRENVSILGDGAAETVVDAQARPGSAGPVRDRVFHVLAGVTASLADLTIKGGFSSRYCYEPALGSGVLNEGVLGIARSAVIENQAEDSSGAGIASTGQLEVVDSLVSRNLGGYEDTWGAGIASDGSLSIRGTTISHNTAALGGGISGSVTAVNSTISSNRTRLGGGGILGAAWLDNSTVTANSASEYGAGGISGAAVLYHSIVAGNTVGASFGEIGDCDLSTSAGSNLVGRGTGCSSDGPGDRSVDPAIVFSHVLGPLKDNGGPTATHALLAGSPAVDGGDPDGCLEGGLPLAVDQRGFPRPRDGDGDGHAVCDIGAFEAPQEICTDLDGDGYCSPADCDDTRPFCNADCTDHDLDSYCRPQDCDDRIATCARDCTLDRDGDGSPACGDCNEAAPAVFPGAAEICDGIDTDCDGLVDDDVACRSTCDLPYRVGDALPVSHATGDPSVPAVVWTGSEFGVVWSDSSDDGVTAQLYFARLAPDGAPVGGEARLTTGGARADRPTIVWTGSEFAIAWEDYRDGAKAEIYFARLDASGNRIGGDVRLTNDAVHSLDPVLVWTGSAYGLAWDDSTTGKRQVYFRLLDSTGAAIGSRLRVTRTSAAADHPSLVWTGAEFGLAWQDSRHGAAGEIYFARIVAKGDAVGLETRLTHAGATSANVSLAWTGSEYGAVWEDSRAGDRDVYFTRIDTTGLEIGDDRSVADLPGQAESPILTWTGGEYAFVWHERRGARRAYFARVDAASGVPGGAIRVHEGALDSQLPRLAWTGVHYGIVCSSGPAGSREIYFTTVACDPVDP